MEKDMRIVSLLPSGTEIICALGLEDHLVGRSHECDYPESVKSLPVCSEPNYKRKGSSAEINQSVQATLQEALSIYKVDIDKIKALKPTHIVTQSQCEVCAISSRELHEALKDFIRDKHVHVLDSNPATLEDIYDKIEQIAQSADVVHEGNRLTEQMKNSFANIRRRTEQLTSKPAVAHIEWIEPVMVGGHWMMSLIKWAGGWNCFLDENQRWISLEEIIEHNPDKIVIAPCGFSTDRTLQDMFYFEQKKEWWALDAVKNNEVYLSDGSTYFNRPGPRLVDSLEILAQIYHPEIFPANNKSANWLRIYH